MSSRSDRHHTHMGHMHTPYRAPALKAGRQVYLRHPSRGPSHALISHLNPHPTAPVKGGLGFPHALTTVINLGLTTSVQGRRGLVARAAMQARDVRQ